MRQHPESAHLPRIDRESAAEQIKHLLAEQQSWAQSLKEFVVRPEREWHPNTEVRMIFATAVFSIAYVGSLLWFKTDSVDQAPVVAAGAVKSIDGGVLDGTYSVWTTEGSDDSPERETVSETASEMAEGVRDVEIYFGVKPGDMVKGLCAVPSADENAWVNMAGVDVGFVYFSIANAYDPKHTALDNIVTGRHEALHKAGEFFGKVDQSPEWQRFWEQSSHRGHERFSHAEINVFGRHEGDMGEPNVNEGNHYWPFTAVGGHAWENQVELFASFMNTVMDEDWETKMHDINVDAQYLHWQLEGLMVLRSLFETQREYQIPADAPLHESFNQKIVFLQTLVETRESISTSVSVGEAVAHHGAQKAALSVLPAHEELEDAESMEEVAQGSVAKAARDLFGK